MLLALQSGIDYTGAIKKEVNQPQLKEPKVFPKPWLRMADLEP